MELENRVSSYVLVRCLDADRRVGTEDRDRDTIAAKVMSSSLTVTVKVKVTTC